MQVLVRDNIVDQALKALKKKMQREGIFREMTLRNYYEKPSERRVREMAEAVRRARKLARKASAGDIIVIHDGHHRNPRADRDLHAGAGHDVGDGDQRDRAVGRDPHRAPGR